MFDFTRQDVRLAVRTLRNNPGFSTVAVSTIAISIAAATLAFSVVNGALMQPLPYGDAGSLVAIFQTEHNDASAVREDRNPTSPANFADWKRSADFIDHMTAAHPWNPVMTGAARPNRLAGLKATPGLFELLGVAPRLGRTFGPADETNPNVIVLGSGTWETVFGGRPDILGTTINLDGDPFEVIGVMPPEFRFPPFWAVEADMWVPLVFDPETAQNRHAAFLRVFGRRTGVSVSEAQARMDGIAGRLEAQYESANAGIGINVEPLAEPGTSAVRPAVLILSSTVGLLLFIACANVANLLLSRASSRQAELAVRSALGASRTRLVRQWFTESLVLGALGGTIGAGLAVLAVRPLATVLAPLMPVTATIAIDIPVLGFAVVVSVIAALLFGTLPALHASSAGLSTTIRAGRMAGRSNSARLSLVTVQVALAIVMLAGAGLFTRTLLALVQHDPGFVTENALAMDISFAASANNEYERRVITTNTMLESVQSLPGVRAAGVVNHIPVGSDIWRTRFSTPDQPPNPAEDARAVMRVADAGFARAMGLQLLQGKWFDGTETADGQRVVVVNEAMARHLNTSNAVGHRIRLGADDTSPIAEIIGVYRNANQFALRREVAPEVYYPLTQDPTPWNTEVSLVVASDNLTPGLIASVRERIWQADAAVPITNVRGIERILDDQVVRERVSVTLMGALAATALILCAIGVYGVISYLSALRNREIAVRAALGATPRQILGLVTRDGLMMAVPGLVLGLMGAIGLGRMVQSMLWQVTPGDPTSLTAAVLLLIIVTATATVLPGLRASRTDPADVLREE